MSEVITRAKENITRLTNLPVDSAVGVLEDEGGWKLTLELLERKSIPDTADILGVYETRIDADGNVRSFNRLTLRRRGDTLGKKM